jgi:hypothetical protein
MLVSSNILVFCLFFELDLTDIYWDEDGVFLKNLCEVSVNSILITAVSFVFFTTSYSRGINHVLPCSDSGKAGKMPP